jgi:hypothetical protein
MRRREETCNTLIIITDIANLRVDREHHQCLQTIPSSSSSPNWIPGNLQCLPAMEAFTYYRDGASKGAKELCAKW